MTCITGVIYDPEDYVRFLKNKKQRVLSSCFLFPQNVQAQTGARFLSPAAGNLIVLPRFADYPIQRPALFGRAQLCLVSGQKAVITVTVRSI